MTRSGKCHFVLYFALLNNLKCVICIVFSGLISPGVSVPIQVPGGGAQDMSAHHMGPMPSQYWPRIQ